MAPAYRYHPIRFFASTYLVTWVSWFAAAVVSYLPGGKQMYVLLLLPGLVAPFAVAAWLIFTAGSQELVRDFYRRLFDLRSIRPLSLVAMVLIMPAVVLSSILISLAFGQSLAQFGLAGGFSFSVGSLPVLLVLVLAAAFEELGWRSYALDSLGVRFSYFTATMIFAALWAGWHLPLFFIKGYYQNEIATQNLWFGINFMLSVIPLAFIIGWLCRWNRGSILVAIGFHFFVNICQEALQVTQVTKCIETLVLVLVAAVVVALNREMFFQEKPRPVVQLEIGTSDSIETSSREQNY